jgi:uncharacterized protein YfiM (DUF2279 family)
MTSRYNALFSNAKIAAWSGIDSQQQPSAHRWLAAAGRAAGDTSQHKMNQMIIAGF